MRKAEQAKIVEYLKVLHGAHKELDKAALQENHPKIISGCQELAAQVAQYISETKGPGTQTASSLEEYRQYLSQAEAAPNGIDKYFIKKLRAKLFRIETLAQSELKPNKIEVLFLPYKYSMADSLESIWLAAMADPQCDVKICPIPYYDRLPGGTFGQMHYEGDCYPKSLPLVDWQAYDIESSRPDAIFIHNPYDEGNYVTSVHPNFYSKRLRGLTDMLVYVPYFVVMDDIPDHFVTVPGCIYAHKVIVQSEKVRQTYIRTFKDKFGDAFGKPEDKFLALGSPKFDKVLNTKREDYQLPEEWQRLIGNKKVIFYNSTISAILNGNEQYLKKLRQILDTFRSRDDVVLWWRPHPLNDATYSSMRPQLLAEYKQIISDYKSQAWGIFDETPDPHMVIAYSDAYYGDWSSLVPMYQVTDKPIMIAHASINPNAEPGELVFENLCKSNGRLWFTSINFNSLWAMDSDTWEVEHIGLFPDEEAYQSRQFFSLVMANDRIYCIPLSANNLIEYSPADKAFRAIPLPIPQYKAASKIVYSPDLKFLCGYVYGDHLFITPYTYPGIIKYSLSTGNIVVLDDWITDLDSMHSTKHFLGYFNRGVAQDNKLFLACCGANAVFEFDMETCLHRIHKIKNENIGYIGMCFDGENYWLSPVNNNGVVVKWNPMEGVIKELRNLCDCQTQELFPFQNISFLRGNIWLLPLLYNSDTKAIKIDVNTNAVTIADNFQNETTYVSENALYSNTHSYLLQEKIEDTLFAYSAKTNSLLAYNALTNETRKQTITMSADNYIQIADGICQYVKNNIKKNKLVYQEYCFSLNDFLNLPVNDPSSVFEEQNTENAGKKICALTKNLLLQLG